MLDLAYITKQLKADIEEYCVNKYNDGHRSHLGASQIGKECERFLWYQFRWVFHKVFTGRQYRLFQRGHLEEARFVEYLRGIGCEVTVFDKVLLFHPESDCYYYGSESECCEGDGLTEIVEGIPHHEQAAKSAGVYLDKSKRQIRISGVNGHFGGSLDLIIRLPKHYDVPEDVLFLGECKTNGTGKGFTDLLTQGVQQAKPEHWDQMCVYGYKKNLKYGIYLNTNKNDDDLHVEVIELDHERGVELERKAERIIYATEPPAGIGKSSAFYKCKSCDFCEVCHSNKPIDKNCRSCVNSKPVDNAQWECSHYGIIPKEHLPKGCDNWDAIC